MTVKLKSAYCFFLKRRFSKVGDSNIFQLNLSGWSVDKTSRGCFFLASS
jgi:hypothetical protein